MAREPRPRIVHRKGISRALQVYHALVQFEVAVRQDEQHLALAAMGAHPDPSYQRRYVQIKRQFADLIGVRRVMQDAPAEIRRRAPILSVKPDEYEAISRMAWRLDTEDDRRLILAALQRWGDATGLVTTR